MMMMMMMMIKNYRTAGSFGMCTLERKIDAIKTQNVSENGTAQINFPYFCDTQNEIMKMYGGI